jgi:hypothetical protein
MKKIFTTIFVVIICAIHLNAQSVTLKFNNLFNGSPIEFGKHYQTPLGDSVTFSTLNYFISNIQLVNTNGKVYTVPQDSSYFLLKQSDPASTSIQLNNIPAGEYNSVQFTVGVDSIRNTMDVSKRTGSLDVGAAARGMYWVWNSGYIFFKLEGKTLNDVDSLRKNFRYHIGGYGGYETKTINNIKTKKFVLNNIAIATVKKPKIEVNVSIDQFFNAITPIHILEHPSVMWGNFSVKIADNYETIFNIGNISYE